MGTSTNGQICFGIVFDEGFAFPWDADDEGGYLDDWWREKVCAYKPPFECYGDSGRLPGITEKHVSEYHKHRRDFDAAHPVPVKEVNYCSGDYPMMILAVPGTCLTNHRGDPKELDLSALVVTPEQVQSLIDFCNTHGIELTEDQKPKWWLSSYWG